MELKDWKKIHEYCMSLPCTYESRPFGKEPICYRIAGKIFCQLSTDENWFKATIKSEPDASDFLRQSYPEVIVPGYHCPEMQRPYWNTVELCEVEFDLVKNLIDAGYEAAIRGLTKKEQGRIPLRAEYTFVKTDGANAEFVENCKKLDKSLREMVGDEVQDQNNYDQYNSLNDIHDVILIKKGDICVGAGAYKQYDDESVEIKRVFVSPEHRRAGLAKELILRLEADARISDFRFSVLETGRPMEAARALYKKCGYKEIENYGPYIGLEESVRMRKRI